MDLTEQFPVIDRHVWLNHAAISPWPAAVSKAMSDYVKDNANQGPLGYRRWLETEARLRERAARLLGADSADDIALVANTSTGLNRIARGLDWESGDSVVFPASDFPSNRLPWQGLASRGVEARAVELEPRDPERALIGAIGPSTRLMSVSSIQYDTGLKLDLKRLGDACARHGVLFCIDAIQQLGALPLDLEHSGADFVVAGSHKWLLAPEGLALFWSRPEARAQLELVDPGWRMYPDPFNFERTDHSAPNGAVRFEPGTLNTAGIFGLDAAIGLLLDLDPEQSAQALLDRTDRLTDGLMKMPGVGLASPLERERRAGIVSFRMSSMSAERVTAELAKHAIHAAPRGKLVRLSPHFYTPLAQIEKTIESIAELAARRG
jgi:cysteine desulfurase / selenocysteine lyase